MAKKINLIIFLIQLLIGVCMGSGNNIKCRECGKNDATYRCTNCGYVICPHCAENLGGGAWSNPKCPMCESKEWKGA